ncbi:MAG: adenylate kinase [Elusimicrobiota bacterium]
MLNLIIFGPPGAGKGTQAVLISETYKIPAISTGDIFREAAGSESESGKKIKAAMKSGNLVDDSVVIDVVVERLARPDCSRGFILDGFPRTLNQAVELDKFLTAKKIKIDRVISFNVGEDGLVRRLSKRRVCKQCKKIYNLFTAAPKKQGVCDVCGGSLYQREDDQPATIKQRLQVYSQQTQPVLDYYRKSGNLVSMEADFSPEEVFIALSKMLGV